MFCLVVMLVMNCISKTKVFVYVCEYFDGVNDFNINEYALVELLANYYLLNFCFKFSNSNLYSAYYHVTFLFIFVFCSMEKDF